MDLGQHLSVGFVSFIYPFLLSIFRCSSIAVGLEHALSVSLRLKVRWVYSSGFEIIRIYYRFVRVLSNGKASGLSHVPGPQTNFTVGSTTEFQRFVVLSYTKSFQLSN